MKVSVCVCAYNEGNTIAQVLKALIEQRLGFIEISEIIVVSSDCHDATDVIARAFSQHDNRVKLIQEKERTGKAGALNLFLKQAKESVCVLIGADVLPDINCIENLCAPFLSGRVGMTGARIIPLDDDNTFFGYATHIIWEMVSKLSYILPKLGEAIAFRRIKEISPQTAVDEAFIENIITKQGLKLQYAPNAIVYNHGAATLKDYTSQRIRIHTGHLQLRKETGYMVSTMRMRPKIKLAAGYYLVQLKHVVWYPVYVLLEIACMIIAWYKFRLRHDNPYIWEMVKTSKTLEVK
jgi:biofilm PGA synthesis N-glycosyltransferase PgaC